MNTQLFILSSGTTFATSGVIDLYEDVPMSLNLNIADIKEPQKRNADYSKTITAPGTNNNNNLLSHIYEIGIDRLYNPNKKVEARIVQDGINVFKGYLRLVKIRKLRDEKVEYDFEIRGRLDDIFTNLIDLKLTDLTWSDLDHTYNQTSITNSWTTPVGSNYVYPFIDYGYEPNINNISVDHLFPAVYVKEAWDRIFRTAGFQYSSTFLTSTYFKSLIMPFTGENMRLTDAQIDARKFQASRLTTNQTHVPFSSSGSIQYFNNVFNDDSTTPNSDGGSNYNTSTGVYTVPASGYYYFTANLSVNGVATPHGANQYINYYIVAYPRLIVNGVAKSYGASFAYTFTAAQVSTAQTDTSNPQGVNQYVTYSAQLNAGDTVYIDLQAWLIASANPALVGKPIGNVDYQLRLNTGSYFYAKPEPIIKNGDTITFANTLPAEMKIVDFLVSIIKMHNLYFEYDKDIPNKIYIEPRNDYYNSTIQDWSNKLDASQEPEIIPMGALNAKRYQFTYKKDGDVLNDIYYKTYGEVYAEKRKDIDNDFLKNTEKMELIFSPTPQYNKVGTGKAYPALYNIDSSMKVVHNKSMNPRILYYGGLKSCSTWYIYTVNGNAFSYSSALTTYPYCGMMDDPDAPTVSLDFEVPYEIFYTPTWNASYSNNNLYNKYWKQFIDEITDYNSSIVTGWFWLTPADVLQIDFRHIYRFLNQNFRLNKVYDYNPSSNSLTRCEFIKVKNGIPFSPASHIIKGGKAQTNQGTGTNSTRTVNPPSAENQGGNSMSALGNIQQISGSLNYVSPTAYNVTVQGNANSIGEGANNIQVLNSSGCIVAGGLVNVSILNSSGVTVTTSNTSVINGVVQFSPGSTPSGNYWSPNGTHIWNTNTGNVGINTQNPLTKLEVKDGDLSLGVWSGSASKRFMGLTNASGSFADTAGGASIYFENIGTNSQAIGFKTHNTGVDHTTRFYITHDGRLYGTSIHNNSGAVTGTTNQYIASGTYTPAHSGLSNLSATTPYDAQWIRVGNVVNVSGYFEADGTAATSASFQMTLPITTTVGASQCNGTANGSIGGYAIISGNGADKALVQWTNNTSTNSGYAFVFTYIIL